MTLLELIYYFSLYSGMGFVLEFLFRSVVSRSLVYPGFLYGPYCPIYGVGLILMQLLLAPFQGNLFLFLLLAFFLTSFIEYVTGYLLEKLLGVRLWDYKDKLLNIQGRVALQFSLFWTLLAYLFVYRLHPIVVGLSQGVLESSLAPVLGFFLLVVFSVDTAMSVNKAIYIRQNISGLELLSREIEELKNGAGERLEQLRIDYEERLSRLLRSNRQLLIYSNPKFISKRFPGVMESLKEAREKLRKVHWFKEEKNDS